MPSNAQGFKPLIESQFFKSAGDDAVRLYNLCLQVDSGTAHFTIGSPPGPHIAKIQEALNQVQPKIPNQKPITDPPGTYGRSTADAVMAYKLANGLQRPGQPYDAIVGRMTMARLDDEMLNGEGPSPTPTPGPPAPTQKKPIDLFIQIHGINPADARSGTETADDPFGNIEFIKKQVETPAYQATRELRVINFYGAPGLKSPADTIAAKVDEALAQSAPGGKIVLMGSSIGGKNAANLAFKLQKKAALKYVALIDGGFDNASDSDLLAGIKAEKADSFYEPMTNDWSDVMGFVEFHGVAAGTRDHNVMDVSPAFYAGIAASFFVLRQRPNLPGARGAAALAARGLFKQAHDQAVGDGTNIAISRAATALTP